MRLSRYAFLMLVAFVAHPAFARCEFKDSRQQQQCIQQEQAQLRAQQQAQQRAQEQQRQQQVQRQQQEQSRRAQEQQRQQLEAHQRAQESQRQRQAAQQQAQQQQAQQQREAQIRQQQQQAQQQRQQQLQLQQAERQRQAQQHDRQEAQRRAQEQTRQADLRRQQQNAERQHREDLVRAQAERQRRDDAQRRIEQDRQREQERRSVAQREEQQRNAELARRQQQAQAARVEAQHREQQRRDQEAQVKREREHQARAPATLASGCSDKHGRAHDQCLAERERARQDPRTREAQQREALQREQRQEASARQQELQQQQQRDVQLRQQQAQQRQQEQARQQPSRSLAVDQSAAARQKNPQLANRPLIIEAAKLLPQTAADFAKGAAEGAYVGGSNFVKGTAAFGKQVVDPNTYIGAAKEARDIVKDPRGVGAQDGRIVLQAGRTVLDSTKKAAGKYVEDIRKGDARAAGRDVTEPVTELIGDVATGKLVSRGAKVISQVAEGASKATAPLNSEVGSASARLGKQESNLASYQAISSLRLGEKADSRILRQNLEATGVKSSSGYQAHHIIGEAYPEGVEARRILAKYGIDVNAPENGVFLPSRGGSEVSKMAVHSGKHAREYEVDTLRRLKDAQTRDEAVAILSNIRNELLRGTIKLNEAN